MKSMVALLDLQCEKADCETEHLYGVILPHQKDETINWVAEVYHNKTNGLIETIDDHDLERLQRRLDLLLRLHEQRAYGSME